MLKHKNFVFLSKLIFISFLFLNSSANADWLVCRMAYSAKNFLFNSSDTSLSKSLKPKLSEDFTLKIDQFHIMNSLEQKASLLEAAEQFRLAVIEKFGHDQIGFHFNLHGGTAESYIEKGGILGTNKHPESYVSHPDLIPSRDLMNIGRRVYFFSLSSSDLFTILNSKPNFLRARYGNVLVVFDLKKVREKYGDKIAEESDFHLEFIDGFNPRVAVPKEFFLAEPLNVFSPHRRYDLQQRMTRNEETYLEMLHLTKAIHDS